MSKNDSVFVVEALGEDRKKITLVLYDATNEAECTRIVKETLGKKAVVKKIARMSEYEYKHMFKE